MICAPGDDICGVSLAIRFNSYLILVWTRDADNEKSRDAVLKKVLEMLPEDMRPQPTAPYYKKHSDHKGYGEK